MGEFIEIRGARENNLRDVSLLIPKRKITIFTGVSGSGTRPRRSASQAHESTARCASASAASARTPN